MSIVKSEYENIIGLFESEKNSFETRKTTVDNIPITSKNWSSSYLDFFNYDSAINQLKESVIFKEETKISIKNYYFENQLIFSCNNENEKWGSLFLEYNDRNKKSFLFVENDDEEMALQQLRVAYFHNNRYDKVLSYINDGDNHEEFLFIDQFEYDNADITKIVRYGFWEEKSNILPIREFEFSYIGAKVKIVATNQSGKKILVYNGKKISNDSLCQDSCHPLNLNRESL